MDSDNTVKGEKPGEEISLNEVLESLLEANKQRASPDREVLSAFRRTLRMFRVQRMQTRQSFAELLGVSAQTLYRREAVDRSPPPKKDNLLKLIRVCGMKEIACSMRSGTGFNSLREVVTRLRLSSKPPTNLMILNPRSVQKRVGDMLGQLMPFLEEGVDIYLLSAPSFVLDGTQSYSDFDNSSIGPEWEWLRVCNIAELGTPGKIVFLATSEIQAGNLNRFSENVLQVDIKELVPFSCRVLPLLVNELTSYLLYWSNMFPVEEGGLIQCSVDGDSTRLVAISGDAESSRHTSEIFYRLLLHINHLRSES